MRENILKKIRLALLGKNISHSKSQQMYEELLGLPINYLHYDCEDSSSIPSLEEIFQERMGLSITAPYKEHFLEKCQIDEELRGLQAINCIKKDGGIFYATNTDYSACCEILSAYKNKYKNLRIYLLGDGAMSRVILAACIKQNIDIEIFSRKKNKDFFEMSFKKHRADQEYQVLIINSCARNYVFKNELDKNDLFWDLNYEFTPHHYLKDKVLQFSDGLELLKLQAKHALEFWSIN